MKKYLPYILLGALLLILFAMMGSGPSEAKKEVDLRPSFKKADKRPYGGYIAYENLKTFFPLAKVERETTSPDSWKHISRYWSNQALVIVTPRFDPSEEEWNEIYKFIERGNDVFISTTFLNFTVERQVKTDLYVSAFYDLDAKFFVDPESMAVSLTVPAGAGKKVYKYPGHDYGTWFNRFDTSTSRILGYDGYGRTNFIGLKAGKGNLFLNLAPITFTNYFLLHKGNMEYYDQVFSLLSERATLVAWDEYYSSRKKPQKEDKHWLRVLLKLENADGKRSFAAAFWLLLGILLLYAVNDMRRKQRPIPVMRAPANDSLEFVKTIGRLYHDKGDHANLCRKMTAYFLEHVRSRYKMQTLQLNDDFVKELAYKSGADEQLLRDIVGFIETVATNDSITAQSMAWYHEKLETFYKHS